MLKDVSSGRLKNSRAPQSGFTLIEATFAILIFGTMGLVFAAIVPVALHTAQMSSRYAQAAALAQHKVDQLRGAGFTALQTPAQLVSLGIIDSGTSTSTVVPYTASFANIDNLVANGSNPGLFPPGSTATISVADYNSINAAVPAGKVDTVTVSVQWTGGPVPAGGRTTNALVIQMPHS